MSRNNTHKVGVNISDFTKMERGELNHVIARNDMPHYFQINDTIIIACLNSKGLEEEFSPKLIKYVTNSAYLWQQVPLNCYDAPESFRGLYAVSFGSPIREDNDD